jgi:ABC-2 type transport system permease protein
MTMLTAIVRKEFTEMWRDGRVRATSIALLLLLTGATAYGWQQTRALGAERRAAQELTRSHWVSQPARNPHSAAHYGIYAFKPRTTLATLDDGVDPYTGVLAWLEAHKQNEFKYRPAQDASSAQRFGSLTAALTLQLLVPLLIVLVAHAAFAREREQGTLRQLLSLGVSPVTLGVGKAVGSAAALGVVLVPAALIGALALVGLGDDGSLDLGRVLTLSGVYLLYFFAWLCVTLIASIRSNTARGALAGSLAVWMVTTVLAPRLATEVVRRVQPTPSAQTFAAAIKRDLAGGMEGHGGRDAHFAAFEARVLKQYGVDSISQLPVSFSGLELEEGERWGNKVFDKHYGALWQAFDTQERVRSWIGTVAPVLSIKAMSMGLAGTDVAHHRRFADASEAYRRSLVTRMNNAMQKTADGDDFAVKADPALWKSVGAFAYTLPGLAWAVHQHRIDAMVLACWALLSAVLLWRTLHRLTP